MIVNPKTPGRLEKGFWKTPASEKKLLRAFYRVVGHHVALIEQKLYVPIGARHCLVVHSTAIPAHSLKNNGKTTDTSDSPPRVTIVTILHASRRELDLARFKRHRYDKSPCRSPFTPRKIPRFRFPTWTRRHSSAASASRAESLARWNRKRLVSGGGGAFHPASREY